MTDTTDQAATTARPASEAASRAAQLDLVSVLCREAGHDPATTVVRIVGPGFGEVYLRAGRPVTVEFTPRPGGADKPARKAKG